MSSLILRMPSTMLSFLEHQSQENGVGFSKFVTQILDSLESVDELISYPESREKEVFYRLIRASIFWEYVSSKLNKIPQLAWLARQRVYSCWQDAGLEKEVVNHQENLILFYVLYCAELPWCCVQHFNPRPPEVTREAILKRVKSLSEFYQPKMAKYILNHKVCSLEKINFPKEEIARKNTSLPDTLKEKLSSLAEEKSTSPATLIRQILEGYCLKKYPSVELCEFVQREQMLTFLALYSCAVVETILAQTSPHHPDVVTPAREKTFRLLGPKKDDHLLFYSLYCDQLVRETAYRRMVKIVPPEKMLGEVENTLSSLESREEYKGCFSGRLFE